MLRLKAELADVKSTVEQQQDHIVRLTKERATVEHQHRTELSSKVCLHRHSDFRSLSSSHK